MRKVQIIMIENELSDPRYFNVSKRMLKFITFVMLFTFVSLVTFSVFGFKAYRDSRVLSAKLGVYKKENEDLRSKVAFLEKEKKESVTEIAKRIEMIDSIMKNVGLHKKLDSFDGEGGIYIPLDRVDEVDLNAVAENADELIRKLKTTPLSYPAPGRITSGFTIRRDPFTHRLAFHPGIDLANSRGVPVRVTADGVVEKACWWGEWGKIIVVRHTRDLKTVYAHLSKIYVRKGQRVYRGQIIGAIGSTGRSTGPHLHYGIRYKGKWINPMKFMEVRVDREKG